MPLGKFTMIATFAASTAVAAVVLLYGMSGALAQNFPVRPVRMLTTSVTRRIRAVRLPQQRAVSGWENCAPARWLDRILPSLTTFWPWTMTILRS